MPEPQELQALLSRIEAATGPLDPETSCRINSIGFGEVTEFSGPYRGDCGEDEYSCFVTRDGVRRQRRISENEFPDRSIDAALALVERMLPGCWWFFSKGRTRPTEPLFGFHIIPEGNVDGKTIGAGEGPTECLAILAALLRALSQTTPEEK